MGKMNLNEISLLVMGTILKVIIWECKAKPHLYICRTVHISHSGFPCLHIVAHHMTRVVMTLLDAVENSSVYPEYSERSDSCRCYTTMASSTRFMTPQAVTDFEMDSALQMD